MQMKKSETFYGFSSFFSLRLAATGTNGTLTQTPSAYWKSGTWALGCVLFASGDGYYAAALRRGLAPHSCHPNTGPRGFVVSNSELPGIPDDRSIKPVRPR
ncbi:hypothetical protein [Oryza sativa Japonica Group]|uniref:Os01g0778000 protein n=2 Tax=Oryza sativa subsp. japonica TaxID=39947 RepID=Q5ZAZ4_ORYSJ|nr:hypothetical protein [Oryza sativa Japonica Group]BAS74621.1 Os01g0778000 [Oryza sativa Japonica Group]